MNSQGIISVITSCTLYTTSGTKNQPKKEVLGRISLLISAQKLWSGPLNPGEFEKQALWHRHLVRTSMTKLRSEKLQLGACTGCVQEKLKGNNLRAKSFRHFVTLFALFHTFTLFQNFSPRAFLKIKAFLKRIKIKKPNHFAR